MKKLLIIALVLFFLSVLAFAQNNGNGGKQPPTAPAMPFSEVCLRLEGTELRAQLTIGTNNAPEVIVRDGEVWLDSVQDVPVTIEVMGRGNYLLTFSIFRPSPPFTNRPDATFEGQIRINVPARTASGFISYVSTTRTFAVGDLAGCLVVPGGTVPCGECY